MRQTPQTPGWIARWLPFACFAVAVSSTVAVLILQAITLKEAAALSLVDLFRQAVAWLFLTALIVPATVAMVFRMDLMQPARFHGDGVQAVTLILLGALIAGMLVVIAVQAGGWPWAAASLAMAGAGLLPLLALRWRRAPA